MHISLISQISSLQHPFRGFHHCVTALETTSGARHAPGRATGTACRHRLGRTTGPGRQRSPSLATHALTAATKHTASARAMPSRGARGRNPGAGGSESRLGRPARSSATEEPRTYHACTNHTKTYPGLLGPPLEHKPQAPQPPAKDPTNRFGVVSCRRYAGWR